MTLSERLRDKEFLTLRSDFLKRFLLHFSILSVDSLQYLQ
jgi:hypothetical protein